MARQSAKHKLAALPSGTVESLVEDDMRQSTPLRPVLRAPGAKRLLVRGGVESFDALARVDRSAGFLLRRPSTSSIRTHPRAGADDAEAG